MLFNYQSNLLTAAADLAMPFLYLNSIAFSRQIDAADPLSYMLQQ
jgi:hypothetical protein